MATREQITFLRAARAGNTDAQLELGRRYLFGRAGMEKNVTSSLYWLHRAAEHGEAEAWLLIGAHVPYETVVRAPDPSRLCIWYERAYKAGVGQAGLVWARLVMQQTAGLPDHPLRRKAIQALQAAAATGIRDAQWLLAQELHQASKTRFQQPGHDDTMAYKVVAQAALDWAAIAATNGVEQAQHALMARAWSAEDYSGFLRWAMPLARAITRPDRKHRARLSEDNVLLLYRCGWALLKTEGSNANDVEQFLYLAAQSGNRDAQYLLGIRCANLDENGERDVLSNRKSNYKKAVGWLTLAAEQGHAEASYSLYKINRKRLAVASKHTALHLEPWLERAAQAGLSAAQLDMGRQLWRRRSDNTSNAERGIYWLQRAADQNNEAATSLLQKIADRPTPAAWALEAQRKMTPQIVTAHPLLVTRIEMAARFGLSCREALALDVNTADKGHCLFIGGSPQSVRSKSRVILIDTVVDRIALTALTSRFEGIDCGVNGPEGNIRKRLSLFKRLFAPTAAVRPH